MTHDIVLLRRRHSLTQGELAQLLGISQTTISRLEADALGPDKIRLEWAMALQVVFGKHPARLFQYHYEELQEAVIGRATELDRALDGKHDQASNYKRALLTDMVRRATIAKRP